MERKELAAKSHRADLRLVLLLLIITPSVLVLNLDLALGIISSNRRALLLWRELFMLPADVNCRGASSSSRSGGSLSCADFTSSSCCKTFPATFSLDGIHGERVIASEKEQN